MYAMKWIFARKMGGGNEKTKNEPQYRQRTGGLYEETERRDEKKPCIVYHNVGDLDGAGGAVVVEFYPQNR